MNYLTRIFLSYETAALCGIHDAYDWHQKIWEAFPHLDGARNGCPANQPGRHFLTRIDAKDGGYQILILSQTEPKRPAWCPDHEINWQTKQIDTAFLNHRAYRFNLRANPTKKVSPRGPDGRCVAQGKRVSLHDPEALSTWIQRKAVQAGCVLVGDVRIDERGVKYFTKKKEQRPGQMNVVDFEGVLRVNDSAAFKSAFGSGIGSAKAFGCGMMLLQPLQ